MEKEKEESERRGQAELPIDITDRPKRLIPVDPVISPFDSGEDKVPGEGTHIPYRPTEHSFSPDTGSESPSSPLRPGYPISHKESTDSEDSIDSETESIMTATTNELIDTLTKTLKNINQSPTIPLPIFKGKKGEDPEDHILKVEDYFVVHQITEQADKINRFKDTLFEMARKWAQNLNYTDVTKFDYDPANANDKIASMKYLFFGKICKGRKNFRSSLQCLGSINI